MSELTALRKVASAALDLCNGGIDEDRPDKMHLFDADVVKALNDALDELDERTPAEAGWLIEWPATKLLPLRWYTPGEPYTFDANKALRFARAEDAEAFLRRGERFSMAADAKAVEHSWVAIPRGAAHRRKG